MAAKLMTTILSIFVLLAGSVSAQDTTNYNWQKSLVVDFLTTQAAYSDSWDGSEVGSFNWTSSLNGVAERQFTKTFNFKSTLKLKFGQTITQNEENNWSKPKKSDDLIDWENVGTYKMKIHIDPYVAFRLESKFLDASIDSDKKYFNPITLTESAGLSKKLYTKDKDNVTSRAGFAIRQLLNSHEGIDNTSDGGLEWVTDASLTLSENMKYVGKLSVFKAFFFSEKDALVGTEAEDYWKAVDVNWENQIDAKVAKYVTVSLYTQVLYDKQISLKGRFKETLGIGFKYTLF